MPTVIGYHDVKDKDHWLASPKREEFFGPLGVTNIRTFVDPTSPTRVAVLMDVADMDALKAAMETPEAAEAMAFDGVVPETLVILRRGIAHVRYEPGGTASPARSRSGARRRQVEVPGQAWLERAARADTGRSQRSRARAATTHGDELPGARRRSAGDQRRWCYVRRSARGLPPCALGHRRWTPSSGC